MSATTKSTFALTKGEVAHLPLLPEPLAAVDDEKVQQAIATFATAASRFPQRG
jgi:hypothetical protein